MKITIVSGSRADWGLLEWPIKTLQEDAYFQGQILKIWGATFDDAFRSCTDSFTAERPDLMLCLGDRFEILAAATAAHLLRVPIAHLCGGDVSAGSYDDAMRDCISRMATYHFCTSAAAWDRLINLGYTNVHMVGSTGVDYIMHAPWRELGTPAIAKPYVLVGYYPETIDGTVDLDAVNEAIAGRPALWLKPNNDIGSDKIHGKWEFSHDQFLRVLANCEEFIGNSSAILYEAPFLGVKTKLIGKRQQGRVVPFGDGRASERIRDILKA